MPSKQPAVAADGVIRRRAARTKPSSAAKIHDRILNAIHERRLRPGTQLVEEKLASIFGVSRTQIRHAITRLAHDGIVTVYPNRGAFVSSPTIEEAREVFDARRLIEPWLIRKLAATGTPAQVKRLRSHVALESEARAAGELESLTCLVIILYDSPHVPACPYDEHSDLIAAIERHDTDGAARRMVEHLDHVEAALDVHEEAARDVDLEAAFA